MSLKSYGITLLILTVYLTCVWCEETEVSAENGDTKLVETGRRRHGIHRWWGLYGIHALAAFYMLKIKAAIAAFLIGSAIVFGFRYLKNSHGCSGIIHESPVITYDHGPAWESGPHDHIPYSLDHNPYEHDHDHHFGGSDIVSDTYPGTSFSGAYSEAEPTAPTAAGDEHHHGRQLDSEEQVSEIMFAFLGIKNNACRKRFICEMEYRSKDNPFTRMAFGIVGRGLFSKYVNNKNPNGRAHSFEECATVNSECELVGANFEETENVDTNETETPNDSENEARSLSDEPKDLEKENEANLKAELESGASQQKDPIAEAIFSRSQSAN